MPKTVKELYSKYNFETERKELEELSAIKTHEFGNVITAARILYGAYDCGEIDSEKLKASVSKLKALDTKTTYPQIDIDTFIKRAEVIKLKLPKDKGLSLEETLGKERILLIDDEYKKFGWDIVFDTIIGPARMSYSESAEDAKKFVCENADSLSLILLDLRLKNSSGESSPEFGLQLLRELKSEHIDIPIVVFSGVDETFYTRECLYAGASNYYVKETSEKDRMKYYLKFKSVISEAISNPEFRKIWKRIKALPKPNHHLLKAYYFLTTPPNDYRIALLFSDVVTKKHIDPSIHYECILQCALAVEKWINQRINKSKKRLDRSEKLKLAGISVHDLSVRSRSEENSQPSKLGTLFSEGKIDVQQKNDIEELFELRNNVAHPARRNRLDKRIITLSKDDALRAFDIALSVISK